MKKRLLAILLVACMAFAVCGCKKEEEKTNEEAAETEAEITESGVPVVDKTVDEEGIEAFVTVKDYMGMELEKTIYTVTEETIDSEIESELSSMPIYDKDEERTVEVGDVVNLDYSGSVDGVVFDGGTAYGYDLEIGSGSFIDGFEDQLVGMHVGESRDITVTFPEDYQAADRAGAEAVFACTINGIAEYVTEPTEEWLLANTTCTTVEEYREEIRKGLEEYYASESESKLYMDAWSKLLENAEFIQYPQDMYDLCYQEQKLSYESYAMMYGMDYESFLEYFGMTEESIRSEAETYLKDALIARYIIDMEGITEEDEGFKNKETEILASNGFETREDAIAAGITEWNVSYVINYNYAMEYVAQNAVVMEVEAEE